MQYLCFYMGFWGNQVDLIIIQLILRLIRRGLGFVTNSVLLVDLTMLECSFLSRPSGSFRCRIGTSPSFATILGLSLRSSSNLLCLLHFFCICLEESHCWQEWMCLVREFSFRWILFASCCWVFCWNRGKDFFVLHYTSAIRLFCPWLWTCHLHYCWIAVQNCLVSFAYPAQHFWLCLSRAPVYLWDLFLHFSCFILQSILRFLLFCYLLQFDVFYDFKFPSIFWLIWVKVHQRG